MDNEQYWAQKLSVLFPRQYHKNGRRHWCHNKNARGNMGPWNKYIAIQSLESNRRRERVKQKTDKKETF